MKQETRNRLFRLCSTAALLVYRLLILFALLWIGYGLENVANAIYALAEDSYSEAPADEQPQDDGGDQAEPLRPSLRSTI